MSSDAPARRGIGAVRSVVTCPAATVIGSAPPSRAHHGVSGMAGSVRPGRTGASGRAAQEAVGGPPFPPIRKAQLARTRREPDGALQIDAVAAEVAVESGDLNKPARLVGVALARRHLGEAESAAMVPAAVQGFAAGK